MERENILLCIRGIIVNILEDESLVIVESTAPEDIDDWDSVTHIQLVSELEKAYGIKLTLKEVMSWESIGDLIDVILSKL